MLTHSWTLPSSVAATAIRETNLCKNAQRFFINPGCFLLTEAKENSWLLPRNGKQFCKIHYFNIWSPILNMFNRYGFSKPVNKRTKSWLLSNITHYTSLRASHSICLALLWSYLSLHWSGYEFSELIEGSYVIIILQVSFVLVCVSCMTPVYKARIQNSLSYKPWMRFCLWSFPELKYTVYQ